MCHEAHVHTLGTFASADDTDMKIDKLNLVEPEDCRGLILAFGYIFHLHPTVKWNQFIKRFKNGMKTQNILRRK